MSSTDLAGLSDLDHWRLCDELSVVQLALLIVGVDPASEEAVGVESKPAPEQPRGFNAVFNALVNAINAQRLPATIRHAAREYGYADAYRDVARPHHLLFSEDEEPVDDSPEDEVVASDQSCIYKPFPDWRLSTVMVEDARAWLSARGVTTGFFFPSQPAEQVLPYLDQKNPRYARKLAAAVSAWLAVTDPGKQSPKQALAKWLRENAASFGLSGDDGNPVEAAVEDCSKVANWQDAGGAPRTGGTDRD